MKKYIITVSSIIIFIIGFYLYNNNNLKLYSKNIFYMDTYINVKIYANNKNKADKILNDVDNIYKEYHQLTDRYTSYDNVKNLYYINNNIGIYEIDDKLYDMLEYGVEWFYKSNGLLNINMGSVIDIWKSYRNDKSGIPTLEELKNSGSIDINNIKLLKNNTIENKGVNLDLGAVSKGYTTEIVSKYLKSIGVKYFLINAGGNVEVGNVYKKSNYKIGIKDPNDTNELFSVVNGNNIAVVTSGSYERYYEYEGKLYHHIINPNTLYPDNYVKSVTVITKDSALGDVLSTTLFMMNVEEGLEFIKNYDADAIWYTNDNQIVKTEGYLKYE